MSNSPRRWLHAHQLSQLAKQGKVTRPRPVAQQIRLSRQMSLHRL